MVWHSQIEDQPEPRFTFSATLSQFPWPSSSYKAEENIHHPVNSSPKPLGSKHLFGPVHINQCPPSLLAGIFTSLHFSAHSALQTQKICVDNPTHGASPEPCCPMESKLRGGKNKSAYQISLGPTIRFAVCKNFQKKFSVYFHGCTIDLWKYHR